jgi:hypothetical protein
LSSNGIGSGGVSCAAAVEIEGAAVVEWFHFTVRVAPNAASAMAHSVVEKNRDRMTLTSYAEIVVEPTTFVA